MDSKCPEIYLDTINRKLLDFDFEKVCSVTLSNTNVYACLCCGKYFQGRGKTTPAYMHSLQEEHHLFMNLNNLKVFLLAENVEVDHESFNDIRAIERLSKESVRSVDLHGKSFYPGFIGMNNLKKNDSINVVLQALLHVVPIRNFLLSTDITHSSNLLKCLGELARKIWNPHPFKAQVSPHEFLQAIALASNKKFSLTQQADVIEFFPWLLNTLHRDLVHYHRSNVISDAFQGTLMVSSRTFQVIRPDNAVRDQAARTEEFVSRTVPFFYLSLDLPPMPLFQAETGENPIPQIALSTLLQKYDGGQLTSKGDIVQAYIPQQLPPFLVLHIRRFIKSEYTLEKNQTVVTFSVNNIDVPMQNITTADPSRMATSLHMAQYKMIANICHVGKIEDGEYLIQVCNQATGQWYEIQDLEVKEIMPQMLFLSDSYLQIWERHSGDTQD